MKSLLAKFKSPGKSPKGPATIAAAAAAAAAIGTDEPSQTQLPQTPEPLQSSASVSPPAQATVPMAVAPPTQAQGRTVLLQQCLDEIEALGQGHVDLLQNMCVEALMPPDVDPGAGGDLARCLLMEGEALLKGQEATHMLGIDDRLAGQGWAAQAGHLNDAQVAQCEELLMQIEPLRSSVLQRLLRLLLPSTVHPVHAAVVCWLLAPLMLGMRPEVMSGTVSTA